MSSHPFNAPRARRCATGLAACLLVSACAGPLAKEPTQTTAVPTTSGDHDDIANARAFFDRYVALSDAFDLAVADLYDDAARIRTSRSEPNGETKRMELSGAQWKGLLRQVLPMAKQLGDVSVFSDVRLSRVDQGVKIAARRYSKLKCYEDAGYFMLVAEDGRGALRIIEESADTQATSTCGIGAGKTLARRLEEISAQIAPTLPVQIDEETRLDRVSYEGTELTYAFTLVTVDSAELERLESALSQLARNEACSAPPLQAVLADGGRVTFRYQEKAGSAERRFTTEASNCQQKP